MNTTYVPPAVRGSLIPIDLYDWASFLKHKYLPMAVLVVTICFLELLYHLSRLTIQWKVKVPELRYLRLTPSKLRHGAPREKPHEQGDEMATELTKVKKRITQLGKVFESFEDEIYGEYTTFGRDLAVLTEVVGELARELSDVRKSIVTLTTELKDLEKKNVGENDVLAHSMDYVLQNFEDIIVRNIAREMEEEKARPANLAQDS